MPRVLLREVYAGGVKGGRGQSPLATPPGRCHLGPLANGPGRNPPYCLRSGGADTNHRGGPQTPEVGYLTSVFCGLLPPQPPPRSLRGWSLPPCFRPQGRPPFPRPWPCFLVPAVSRLPLLPVPALAHWCLLLFFFLVTRRSPRRFGLSSAPPLRPLAVFSLSSPLSWVGGGVGGGGGGVPRCLSPSVSMSRPRCRHEARHWSLCRWGGGG